MRCENPKYQTMPPKSKYRLQSDERPFKRPKNSSEFRLESSLQDRQRGHHSHQRASSFTLPHRSNSRSSSQKGGGNTTTQKGVSKTASFNVQSIPSVKRENSLTSKLQNQSMGIHKLIFDRLNNNDESSEVLSANKCECNSSLTGSIHRSNHHPTTKSKYRFLVTEEQRKLVKFRRFLRAAHICTKPEFLSGIEAIRRRQKREARRSIVDEHGIPPLYTQSR